MSHETFNLKAITVVAFNTSMNIELNIIKLFLFSFVIELEHG